LSAGPVSICSTTLPAVVDVGELHVRQYEGWSEADTTQPVLDRGFEFGDDEAKLHDWSKRNLARWLL
jgi:hypothetical protein